VCLNRASRGGFSAGVTASGNPIWRNPCGSHVLPLFPHALALCRALHELHAPGAAALRHAAHARALDASAAERRNLLGLPGAHDAAPPAADRMQNYLHTLHDNVRTLHYALHAAAECRNFLELGHKNVSL
jgi:exportin-5